MQSTNWSVRRPFPLGLLVIAVSIYIAAGVYSIAADLGSWIADVLTGGSLEGVMLFDSWPIWFGVYAGAGMLAAGLVVAAFAVRREWLLGLLVALCLIALHTTMWTVSGELGHSYLLQVSWPTAALPIGLWAGRAFRLHAIAREALSRERVGWPFCVVAIGAGVIGIIGADALSGGALGRPPSRLSWLDASFFACLYAALLASYRASARFPHRS